MEERLKPLQSFVGILLVAGIGACDNQPSRSAGRPASTSTAACPGSTGPGEATERALALCLTEGEPKLAEWSTAAGPRPVRIYLDLSGSMRGFLDPTYVTDDSTHFRRVIDRMIVGLSPSKAFGYGRSLRPIEPSLGVLGDRKLYSDNDTQMELALEAVASDSALAGTHVLIGDGRRGSPDLANGQFVRIRSIAEQWIASGGTFMLAASLAPFEPVKNDPAGCRDSGSGKGGASRCPLYAISFVAKGDEARIAGALAESFEHLFVYPMPAIPSQMWTIRAATGSEVTVDRGWAHARDGAPIVRVAGGAASTTAVSAALFLRNGPAPLTHALQSALSGQRIGLEISSRPLRPGALGQDWVPLTTRAGHVQPDSTAPLSVSLRSRGPDAQRFIYRVRLFPIGVPTWLANFDARDAADAVRTYGLGTLFELFRQRAQSDRQPAGRAYFVAN